MELAICNGYWIRSCGRRSLRTSTATSVTFHPESYGWRTTPTSIILHAQCSRLFRSWMALWRTNQRIVHPSDLPSSHNRLPLVVTLCHWFYVLVAPIHPFACHHAHCSSCKLGQPLILIIERCCFPWLHFESTALWMQRTLDVRILGSLNEQVTSHLTLVDRSQATKTTMASHA